MLDYSSSPSAKGRLRGSAGPATPPSDGDLAALPGAVSWISVSAGGARLMLQIRRGLDPSSSRSANSAAQSLLLAKLSGKNPYLARFWQNLCTSGTRSGPNCLLSPPYSPNLRTPAKKCRGFQRSITCTSEASLRPDPLLRLGKTDWWNTTGAYELSARTPSLSRGRRGNPHRLASPPRTPKMRMLRKC